MKAGIWIIGIMIVLGLVFKFIDSNTVKVQKPPIENTASSTEPFTVYENKEMGVFLSVPQKYSSNIIINEPLIIPEGASPESVIIESTILNGSGLNPKATDLKKETLGGRPATYVLVGRFEGQILYKFFIKKSNFLIPIDIKWYTAKWSDPEYKTELDPIFIDGRKIISNMKYTDLDLGIYEGVINN